MGVPTHVMEYNGRIAATIGRDAGPLQFAGPLRALDGSEQWSVVLYPLPPGKSYEDVANLPTPEYLQAAGEAERMVVELRKAGGAQWGADWVRYIVGHPHDRNAPVDVAIKLPDTTEIVSQPEVFDAEEAVQLFMTYHRTGDIPPGYVLRPVEGYTTDGGLIKLAEPTV